MKITGFKEFIESIGGGSYLPSTWSNTEADPTNAMPGHSNFLPSLDFAMGSNNVDIPLVKTSGVVLHFDYKKNPIVIELDNKTKIVMNLQQYKSIKGELPIIPKFTKLFVAFQRHPSDLSNTSSQIASCMAKFVGPESLKSTYRIKYV
jgi:hypothetical protein